MKKILSIFTIFSIIVSSSLFQNTVEVQAAELDPDFGNYAEIEGESTTIKLSIDNGDISSSAGNNARAISIPNYIIVSITPKASSYSITVYNIGIDTVDSITLKANVTRNNGTFLKKNSKTFYNVKPGSKTWTWNTKKGDTVQEHITVKASAVDGSSKISASGSTVRYNFAGGKYGTMKAYDGHRHHMPSKSVDGLSDYMGAAIRMIAAEHKNTASYGNTPSAKSFRAKERDLVQQGKFLQAQQLGINDIQTKYGAKYNAAINDMISYTKSLGYVS